MEKDRNENEEEYMKNISFKDFQLEESIERALDSMGYKQPTEVQQKAIPLLLSNKDVIVKASTGSGKTAAYGIPLCEHIDWLENKPQAIVLTPTRELAAQVKEDLINIGRLKRIKAAAVYGKQPFAKQKLELSQKCHIVVGTPGRVLDHIQKGTLSIEKIRYAVIDEADEMLNMGFIDQVGEIMDALPKQRVTMLFSATFSDDIKQLGETFLDSPESIDIEDTPLAKPRIVHEGYLTEEEQKLTLLRDVTTVEGADSCMIFCRTQEQVDRLFEKLAEWDYSCGKIHGGMYQEDRFDVMNQFKRGEFRYLAATDVAARGIDIEEISHVINYDFPHEKEAYVHRAGRTGRAGKMGKAISFITPHERDLLAETQEYAGVSVLIKKAPEKEEVEAARDSFERNMFETEWKKDKGAELNQDIMKLFFNGGKKKKLRAVDFVGTIAKLDGVNAEDIGIITIEDQASFVEILNGKGPYVLQAMKKTTVKGKRLKVYEAFDR